MKRFLLITAILLTAAFHGYGQGVRDLVINELLVRNIDNFEDDYGHRVSWVEFHNTGYSSADLASCYISIASGGETITYRIPKGDPRTTVAPQGYIVFFCEGTDTKGTFHTNFTLSMGLPADSAANKEIRLTLLEANGKDTVNSVTYNLKDQRDDVAIGRLQQADGTYAFVPLATTTPLATNENLDVLPAHEIFRQTDPIGYGMALTAMAVVLTALLCLYLIFRTVGRLNVVFARRRHLKELLAERRQHHHARHAAEPSKLDKKDVMLPGEIAAAIGMALQMYENDMHDHESAVLTINRVQKVYSPWSSKLYGLTPPPMRK